MNHAGFIFAAWGIVAAVLVLYSVRLSVRGRALSKAVDPEHRRWLDSANDANGAPRATRKQP